MNFKLRVIQVFRVERAIRIEVDAENEDTAIELATIGEIDLPDFDDPRWRTSWVLENEDVEPATSGTQR